MGRPNRTWLGPAVALVATLVALVATLVASGVVGWTTFGAGLEIGQRFTELLQRDLDGRHPGCCEVLNAGRMGMTTPTAFAFVLDQVAAWKPDVLIYDSMANDLSDPNEPWALDRNPERMRQYEAHPEVPLRRHQRLHEARLVLARVAEEDVEFPGARIHHQPPGLSCCLPTLPPQPIAPD